MESQTPKKVLIYHRSLDATASGGEFLPLTLISELQRRHCEVTLALDWPSDVADCAKRFGVEIDADAIHVIYIKPKNRFIRDIDVALPFYRSRLMKRRARHFDVCISTFNIFDFGRSAHHFILTLGINDNEFKDYYTHHRARGRLMRMYRKCRSLLVNYVVRPLLGVRSPRAILKDPRERVYPTSLYVNRTMREFFGPFNGIPFYPPTTYHPGPVDDAAHDPLKVVYIGLLSPHKHLSDIISIVERARGMSGVDIKLDIGGRVERNHYCRHMKAVCAKKGWIRFVGPKYGKEKEEFLCSGAYAVHATRVEAFGIAITEYLKSGLVPLVPDEGGACEIVDSKDLTYSTIDEAAGILVRLVTDKAFREGRQRHCRERALEFTSEKYAERQSALLDTILNK